MDDIGGVFEGTLTAKMLVVRATGRIRGRCCFAE